MILKNSAICKKCKKKITSRRRRDFAVCKCGALAIDGGLDYIKISGQDYINACVFSTDSHDKIRNEFEWGSYGKDGKGKLKYIKLRDMETSHIIAILETQKLREEIKKVFIDEIRFRININN